MDKKIEVFRIMNMVMIVDNGVKKIINDKEMLKKSNEEILTIYNKRKCGGDS